MTKSDKWLIAKSDKHEVVKFMFHVSPIEFQNPEFVWHETYVLIVDRYNLLLDFSPENTPETPSDPRQYGTMWVAKENILAFE